MIFFRKQHGFSVLEVTVAGALLGILALAGNKLFSNQIRGQKAVESRSEITTLLMDIRTILAKEQSCKATFLGSAIDVPEGVITFVIPPAPPTPIIPRYQANSNPQLATPYGNGNVKILSYRLSSAADPTDPGIGNFSALPAPSLNRAGTIQLIIKFYIGKHRATGTEILEKKVKINTEINPANQIERCTAIGSYGIDGRYLHRESTDDNYRTMQGNLIIAEPFEIQFPSDLALKYEVEALRNITPKIRKLKPVSYRWKSNDEKVNGLIAQEVQAVFPELVGVNNADGKLTVDYIQLTPLLLQGIQELDKENQNLKKTLIDLKEQQDNMKRELCLKDSTQLFCKGN